MKFAGEEGCRQVLAIRFHRTSHSLLELGYHDLVPLLVMMSSFPSMTVTQNSGLKGGSPLQSDWLLVGQTTYITHDDLIGADKWARLIGKVKMMVDISYDWKPEQP
jgi:hypothetical protein